MRSIFKAFGAVILSAAILLLTVLPASFGTAVSAKAVTESDAKSVILIEARTGAVLFEENADEKLPPASVTKVMTMLLVMEAVDSGRCRLNDTVTVSAHAASMGGSQVFLEENEQMCVEDLLKSVVIASANDAACALAEHIAGSSEAFVKLMNERAADLSMKNTFFENTNGLDDTTENHLTSARDIALMSAELIVKHPKILEYSKIWQDTIRNGEFTLTNTNRLIRFYNGANGLKTGSTSKAKFCISASAERDGMQLIAVVMGSSTRDNRNAAAKALFDYGFANYSFVSFPDGTIADMELFHGNTDNLSCRYDGFEAVIGKGKGGSIKIDFLLPESVEAPVESGEVLGSVIYTLDGEIIGESPVYAAEDAERLTYSGLLIKLLKKYLLI